MSRQVTNTFFRRLFSVRVLNTNRSNCSTRHLSVWHRELHISVSSQFFWHLVVAGKCHATNELMCRVSTWNGEFNVTRGDEGSAQHLPCPSFGSLGHRQTNARWWCSYFAWPDVTSMSDSCNVSTAPKILSIPLTLPVLRWADFTEPYLELNLI